MSGAALHALARWRRLAPALLFGPLACGGGAVGSDGPAATETSDSEDGDVLTAETGSDASDDGVAEPACIAAPTGALAGTERLDGPLGVASVSIEARGCARTYVLRSSATRRDDLPASPRTIAERPGDPVLRSGHDLFDAAYALALAEMHEAEVATISDGSFGGQPTYCGGDAGCFETGRKWTYVWTRDTAYAADLGLATLDPMRAAGSLTFKLSPRRDGGPLQIVQDTGSGGSYPVSSDRVVWALGARAALAQLTGVARTSLRDVTLEALTTTLEHDRKTIFDPAIGLYRGETSFLDWREQTYAAWTQSDVVDIATSSALGTNVLHLHALRLAAELAAEVADARADAYSRQADLLRAAIRERFWLGDAGLFASFLPTTLDPAPVRRFDLLSLALAILHDVASPEEARRVLSTYPHYGPGAPVIWPQQQHAPIYHNRAEWPFVDAYWLLAARHARHDAVSDRMVRALLRGAALNLSNMESFEAGSGAPWLDDGNYSGPVVSSQRQLWSIGGYLAMVQRALFGLEATAEGLRVDPWITRGLRDDLLGASDRLVLQDLPHRGRRVSIVVRLPPVDRSGPVGGAYRVASRALDGVALAGDVVPDARLRDGSRIDVLLEPDPTTAASTLTEADPGDWRAIFGPRTPQVSAIGDDGGKLELALGLGGEAPDGLTLSIYRDGRRVAEGLPATTTRWTDPDSSAANPSSPCYSVESVFTATGNHSQHSRARCWWGPDDDAIQLIDAHAFEAVGGAPVDAHGRFHYQDWGDPGHRLTVRGLVPKRSGPHLFQLTYGNGAGPINTGIACGVKRLTVIDEATDTVIAEGLVVMPQLGRWDRWALSTFVPAVLDATKTYRVVIAADAGTMNMSELAHFATYRGGSGGVDGPFSRVNIAELRVLAR